MSAARARIAELTWTRWTLRLAVLLGTIIVALSLGAGNGPGRIALVAGGALLIFLGSGLASAVRARIAELTRTPWTLRRLCAAFLVVILLGAAYGLLAGAITLSPLIPTYIKTQVEGTQPQRVRTIPINEPPAGREVNPVSKSSACDGAEIMVEQDGRRCFTPGAGKTEYFKDCPTCPEMVVVRAGSLMMGSPSNEPQRSSDEAQLRVSIAAPFAVGKFAVTFDEWDACVADGGCSGYKPNDQGWGRGKYPVVNVNWDDAKAYASWLSRKTGKTYRLLSEAEREYVTRAGTTTPFWWGSSITPKQANYDGSADPYMGGGGKGEYRHRTVPVDSFEANPWGLYQVHGNVWEWTEDCWNESNAGNPGDGRPRTTDTCGQRVVRGGSWFIGPPGLRSAFRNGRVAVLRGNDRGFRPARTLNP
jgi:formylglycine-generating enzyme required for sulfatase activity